MMLSKKDRAISLAKKAAQYASAGQYAEAASKFQQSLLVHPITDNYYNLAFVYEQMGQWKGCVDNYTIYLARYKREHDGADPPEVAGIKRSIEKCRETAQPPITITTSPAGAQVSIDTPDKVLGMTPVEKKLDPGTYKIFISKAGFSTVETKIVVQPKQEGKFHFDLRQEVKKGQVRVIVNVKEATIYIDGKNYGLSPYLETPELEIGRHQIVVKKDLYTSVNASFEVSKGELTELRYDLYLEEPPPSWRSYLGWTFVSLGALAVSGGAIAYYFADQKYNDTQDFRDLQLYQNLGYGLGGSMMGLGISLLIWESFAESVDSKDLIETSGGSDMPVSLRGLSVMPLSNGGVFVSGGLSF
jgi:tetratricopeptide (TPR) repeat protein